jgi:hypothetical protein
MFSKSRREVSIICSPRVGDDLGQLAAATGHLGLMQINAAAWLQQERKFK